MSLTIEATGVRKRSGRTVALDGLDLYAEAGQVSAVLGPNGAGKTTFIRAVATLLRPDAGTLRVAGYDVGREPAQVRRMIGLAGQYAAVEPGMTGRENSTWWLASTARTAAPRRPRSTSRRRRRRPDPPRPGRRRRQLAGTAHTTAPGGSTP